MQKDPGGQLLMNRVLGGTSRQDPGLPQDSAGGIAAKICYHAAQLSLWAPLETACGQAWEHAYNLGRQVTLGQVYATDEQSRVKPLRKATAARRVYSEEAKQAWRDHREAHLAAHTNRSAALQVIRHFRLSSEAFETVRKALARKK